eukprot:532671_1
MDTAKAIFGAVKDGVDGYIRGAAQDQEHNTATVEDVEMATSELATKGDVASVREEVRTYRSQMEAIARILAKKQETEDTMAVSQDSDDTDVINAMIEASINIYKTTPGTSLIKFIKLIDHILESTKPFEDLEP